MLNAVFFIFFRFDCPILPIILVIVHRITDYIFLLVGSWFILIIGLIHTGGNCMFSRIYPAQKMKFSIKDFFSKCDQIRSFLRIWSHLLKRSLMENFVFCAVLVTWWGLIRKHNEIRERVFINSTSKMVNL